MTTIKTVARAFVTGGTAHCHNAQTDGTTYWLHGYAIAKKVGGVVHFDWCGWHTRTTANHMKHILREAGDTYAHVSYATARDRGPETFEWPIISSARRAQPRFIEGSAFTHAPMRNPRDGVSFSFCVCGEPWNQHRSSDGACPMKENA